MTTEMQLAGNVLDELMELALDTPGAETKIVQAVEKRFDVLSEAQVYLLLEKDSDWSDTADCCSLVVDQDDSDRVRVLYAKLAALRALGFETVAGHAS